MAGRRSRRSGRRAKVDPAEDLAPKTPSSSSSGGSTGRTAQCKTPASRLHPQPEDVEEVEAWTQSDRRAMRRRLLDMIHRYYLDAISRLPPTELRTSLARGLLVGGHCFGPLHPVHNIIVNSLWYAAAFPPSDTDDDEDEVHALLSTDGIVRISDRSLDGLLASLRHYCPSLSTGDALWQLFSAGADLAAAIALENGTSKSGGLRAMSSHGLAAFHLGAKTARHPNPMSFAHFASLILPAVNAKHNIVQFLLMNHVLSTEDTCHLSSLLVPALPHEPLQQPLILSPQVLGHIASQKKQFKDTGKQMLNVVNVALQEHNLRSGEQLMLHSVCGASLLKEEGLTDCYHINFLACHGVSDSAVGAPVLFFTEATVLGSDEIKILLCLPVDPVADIGCCFACETNKKKVVHPFYDEYLGGCEFQLDEVDCGSGFSNPLDVDAAEKVSSPSPSSQSSSSSSSYPDHITQRKFPLPDQRQRQSIKDEGGKEVVLEEKPAPRRGARDARALRKLLLSIIRGYYIDAISRLPSAALKAAFAHGLLVGGHCYGPLRPVENIIINSVWYAAAFPFRSDPINVDVITAEGISRLAHRSLDGLVASLRQHCPALSHDVALWHLCLSGADLHGAAASVRGAAPFTRTELEAFPFQVAALVAGHPKPAALARFVTSVLPPMERDVLSLLAAKCRLCLPDIRCLSAMLLPFPLPDELPPQPSPREQNQKIIRIIGARRKRLRIWYQTLLDIAYAALRKFALQTGEHYCLHIIYGQSIAKNEDYELDRYFHINFMAWRNIGLSSSACQREAPVHFFAEAHNPPLRECPVEAVTMCSMLAHLLPCLVDNCYACMINHQKIDHPDAEMHFGGHPHKRDETENNRDCPSSIDVDYRFFDADTDIDFVQYYADRIARVDALCSKYHSKDASVSEDGTSDDGDIYDGDISDEDTSDEDVSRYCRRYI